MTRIILSTRSHTLLRTGGRTNQPAEVSLQQTQSSLSLRTRAPMLVTRCSALAEGGSISPKARGSACSSRKLRRLPTMTCVQACLASASLRPKVHNSRHCCSRVRAYPRYLSHGRPRVLSQTPLFSRKLSRGCAQQCLDVEDKTNR